ncbi:MAG: hypothetical protein HOP24_11350 [Sideroxydans sp.]|nr:hypothetical protein [Sideroxydans sp.]
MRTSIGCGVVLLSVLGNVTEASGVSDAVLAGNRGLSPIISQASRYRGRRVEQSVGDYG